MRSWRAFQAFLVLLCCWTWVPNEATALDRWLARTSDSGKECWLFKSEQDQARQIGGPYKTRSEAYKELCEHVKAGKECESMQYTNPAALCREYKVELN